MLDEIQECYRKGPCLTAAWEERTVHVPDLERDDRFPNYRRDAQDSNVPLIEIATDLTRKATSPAI